MTEQDLEIVTGERCPYCMQETLTLMEKVLELEPFGIVHVFGMKCENDSCGYEMSDIEAEEDKPAYKETIDVDSEDKLGWYVIKSASSTIRIPRMVEISPGPESDGYITTVEGMLHRFKGILEDLRDDADKNVSKKAKNQLKKLTKVLMGRDSLKITLDDPSGNSMFIKERLKLEDGE